MKTQFEENLVIPYFEEFQYRIDNGETLTFEFNKVSYMSFWKSTDTQYSNAPYVRTTCWYTPKTYTNIREQYTALKRFVKRYGLKTSN